MLDYDERKLQLIVKKNKKAFNEFYVETVNTFYRYLKSNYILSESDIQDLLSNLYLRIWNWLNNYKEENNFKSWVWTILKNLVKDYFKSLKMSSFTDMELLTDSNFENSLYTDEQILDFLENDYKYDQIVQAMDNLWEKYKSVIFLKFVEEKSYEEISEILWISNANCRKLLSRGILQLKEFLDKYN